MPKSKKRKGTKLYRPRIDKPCGCQVKLNWGASAQGHWILTMLIDDEKDMGKIWDILINSPEVNESLPTKEMYDKMSFRDLVDYFQIIYDKDLFEPQYEFETQLEEEDE